MSRTIDYYFSIPSPWAYFGFDLFEAIVARHGLVVRYRPVLLAEVFSQTGGLPLAQRPKVRQQYRFIELQRWREKRGLPLNLTPKSFPFDPSLIDRTIIAVIEAGLSPVGLIRAAHRAVWVEDKNLADPGTVAAVLGGLMHEGKPFDAATLVAAAQGEATAAIYARNRDDAVAAGVFGSPAYVLDGEVFWGQDRLDLLEDALASGRAAYRWQI